MAIGQVRTISGTVTQNGQPVSNVSVFQEGSTEVTITNSSGKYQIQVAGNNPVLIFKHPDYAEQRLDIGTISTANIALSNRERQIEEVVLNAGYYKVKEKESTGNIAKVTAKEIANQPVTNVLSSIQGRVSGVNITQSTGVPGAGFDIQIRGKNSLRSAGNEPLYIIDGVPYGGRVNAQNSAAILPSGNISL
jgi:outer membrane receptor protein involved in Fe transport